MASANQTRTNQMNPTARRVKLGDKIVALTTLVNELKDDLTTLIANYNAHTHSGVTAGAAASGAPSVGSAVVVSAPAVDPL